ncbi:hypothetical protein Dimus_024603 [Dionaea muscipula]
MDLRSVQVKYPDPTPLFPRNSFIERSACNLSKMGSFPPGAGRIFFEIGISRHKCSSCSRISFAVRAMAKKSSGNSSSSSSDGDGSKGRDIPEGSKSNDGISQNSNHVTLDWREFRATLFAREQAETAESGVHAHDEAQVDSKSLGVKWAHPISVPEIGSVLVATEKLDRSRSFERTVVLLFRAGTKNPRESQLGVVINRPLHKKIKHMKPNSIDLTATFADSSLHFGGPLEASMFLVKTGENRKVAGCDEVIPGLSFGARNSLDEATRLVKKGVLKPQDFRFFVGYSSWQLDQLKQELDNNLWHVAACSANLIFGATHDSSEGLWEEILQLMGGQYSELSQKPKQDI